MYYAWVVNIGLSIKIYNNISVLVRASACAVRPCVCASTCFGARL